MADAHQVLVIGGGPAGLHCSLLAARHGLRVALLEASEKPGRKLSIAGGGKANFSNRILNEQHYVGEKPAFCRSALRRFSTAHALALCHELGIPWEEREYGQLFGLLPASDFTARFQDACRRAGVDFFPGQSVRSLCKEKGLFRVRTAEGDMRAPQVVIATGSPACPQIGASDSGARLAAALGHRVLPFRPVLAPLIMPPAWPLHGLEGISLPVRLGLCSPATPPSAVPSALRSSSLNPAPPPPLRKDSANQPPSSLSAPRWPDPAGIRSVLFTHRGLSGPAALALSCFWRPGDTVLADFLPELPLSALLHDPAHGRMLVRPLLARHLPARLAERLCPPELARRKVAELGKAERRLLGQAIHAHAVRPCANGGMRHAEAAMGGVAVENLSTRLESRLLPGLFFCGEVLDITGLLGGYNIHWALASASLVADALKKS